jgi:MFS transporter, DHA2 family, multidrug resistance protein
MNEDRNTQEWRPRASPWLIAIAAMTATFMEVLDTSIANVALPHIAGSLSASNDQATWMLTSYLVSNAIVLPATGWLSRRFGRKRFLLACIAIFTASSMLCGVATSLGMLILARVLQGAGGGALQPISQAVLLESFPPARRGLAMAIFGLGVVVAPVVGPTLGGWLTDNYSWRWIFYVNLPMGLLAILMARAFVEDPPYIKNGAETRIDYVGFALLALWLATLQIVLDKGQEADWLSATWIRWFSAVSIAALLGFVVWELHEREPIVDLRVLRDRNFATATALITVVGLVLYASIAVLPLFLQTLLGYPALESGLAVSPRGVGAVFGMLIVGRLVGALDARLLVAIGFGLMAFSAEMLSRVDLVISVGNVAWPNVVNGIAIGFLFVPLTVAATGTLQKEQIGNATGLYNLMRNLGGSVGISLVTTLLARRAQVHQAMLVAHVTPYDGAAQQYLLTLEQRFAAAAGSMDGARQALAALYAVVVKQATLLAFIDVFRLLAIVALLCIPFVLLLKKTKAQGPLAIH